MTDKILLFIPMYNCEKQITRVLGQLRPEVCRYITEVIIINNCSTDNGEIAVKEYLKNTTVNVTVRLLRNNANYGFGGSLKAAFNYAVKHGYDYIIILHGDDQGDISNIMPYLKNKEYAKYDCFLGARFMKGSQLQGYSKLRTFGNIIYNILFSIGAGKKIYDLGSGLNMYRVECLKSGFYKKYNDDMMINYCLILSFIYYRYNIRFFPIVWREDDQVSNVKLVSQAMIVLRILLQYTCNKKKFVESDHRHSARRRYIARQVFSNVCS